MQALDFALDLRQPQRHRLGVTLTLDPTALGGGPIELFLPAWTPGSYLVREFCRHVNDVEARADGALLPVGKTAKNRFRIDPGARPGPLEVRYSVYCHELSVRTADITDEHAFLSGASIFLWPVGVNAHPARVRLEVPAGWTVATSLTRAAPGSEEFTASSLDELVDSPILAGRLETLSFSVFDKPHYLVLDGLDGVEPPAELVPDTIAIIEAAAAVFGGGVPYDEYRFLCMFSDAGRGGLEHLASSALLAPRTTFRPAKQYREFMGLVAHEFFHVWNVKRMRPETLWEFDYEVENYTELLWVAEGFTAYYDDHLCLRARVLSREQYLEAVAQTISELRQTPGRRHQTLAEASHDAWIRLYRPDENTRNSTLSYYGNGALAALCLDLRIRMLTDGARSLDDAVRALYERTFGQGRGYDADDVVAVLGEAAGADLRELVHELVHQPLDPDFGAELAHFGVEFVERDQQTPYLGVRLKPGTTTLSSVLEDGPAAAAGLSPGDEILGLAGLRVSAGEWSDLFESIVRADTPIDVLLARRGRIVTLTVTPSRQPTGQVELRVKPDPTPDQERLRRGWLFEDQRPSA